MYTSKKVKGFDWEFCKNIRQKEHYEMLLRLHNKPLTQEDFLSEWAKLPRVKKKQGVAPNRYRSPSRGRNEYKILKNKFGFFKSP